MSKEVNGVVTQFRYDGDDLILEMDASDAITANYTFGPGIDNPLMMHRDSKNYYYVKDGLGSVTALTDSTGGVVKTYQYSVFGKIVKETGVGVLNPFTYTSREYDSETGNYYYRARYYDAKIGRFLGEDPIGFAGGKNLYRYVDNSPIRFTDPRGLQINDGTKGDRFPHSPSPAPDYTVSGPGGSFGGGAGFIDVTCSPSSNDCGQSCLTCSVRLTTQIFGFGVDIVGFNGSGDGRVDVTFGLGEHGGITASGNGGGSAGAGIGASILGPITVSYVLYTFTTCK